MDKDYTHIYQQTSFEDLGREDKSNHGYNWHRGNILLEGKKEDLLKVIPTREKEYFRNDIESEAFWRIFKSLNYPLEKAGEREPDSPYNLLLGDNSILPSVVDFVINASLYTGKRESFPGYSMGNSILLKEMRNPDSIIYNIAKPGFKKRIVNNALWEQIGAHSSMELENILSQEAGLLDPSFADAGCKILEMNNYEYLSEHPRFNFSPLSKGAMINFADFASKLKNSNIPPGRKDDFYKIFVSDYIEALFDKDAWDVSYFRNEERMQLIELVQ
jgi:hypothetical protein